MKIYSRFLKNETVTTSKGNVLFVAGVADVSDEVGTMLLQLPKDFSETAFGTTGPISIASNPSPEGKGMVAASVMTKKREAQDKAVAARQGTAKPAEKAQEDPSGKKK